MFHLLLIYYEIIFKQSRLITCKEQKNLRLLKWLKVTSKKKKKNEENEGKKARAFYFKGCNWSIEPPSPPPLCKKLVSGFYSYILTHHERGLF